MAEHIFNYHEDDDERTLIARRYRGTTSLAAPYRISHRTQPLEVQAISGPPVGSNKPSNYEQPFFRKLPADNGSTLMALP